MRKFKSHSLLKLVNGYVIDASQPSNISYMWNFGSLLLVCLIIQIISGVTLAMHYSPNVLEAFNSIEHIMRDVNNGWLIRYLHSNTASAFFFLVYLHIGRGMYYGSYRSPRSLTWVIGTVILILMMGTAFLGYEHSPKWFNNNKMIIYNSKKINKYNSNKIVRYYSTSRSVNNKHYNIISKFLNDNNLKPVFIFECLRNENTKNNIKDQTKNLSGVYLILNKTTKDFYIGSGSTDKLYTKFYRHLINLTGSKIVKLAVNKYGIDNFAFIVLETFTEKTTVENNKNLLDVEDFYIKSLLPNYNILTEAGSSFGYRHTELDRIKMKTNYSEECRKSLGNLNKNKEFSLSIIEKMKQSDLNRNKVEFNKGALKNMKKACKPIILYNIENNTVFGEYNSRTNAALSLNCNLKTISRALKTKKKILLKRWIVKEK
jgi:group I intron endonuclease